MAIIFEQIGRINFATVDLPLPTISMIEGMMGLNTDNGDKVTFKDGAWVSGWYNPYIIPPDSGDASEVLSNVDISTLLVNHSGTVRALPASHSFSFINDGELNLRDLKMIEAEIVLTRDTLDLLCSIKSFRISTGVFDYKIEYYGYDDDVHITNTVINGELILLIHAPGPVDVEVYVRTIIE